MAGAEGLDPKHDGNGKAASAWRGRLVTIAFALVLIAIWGAAREGQISAPVTVLAAGIATIAYIVIQVRRWRRG